MDTRSLFKSAAAAALVALSAVSTNALTIEYQAINLANTTPGQDLWRYTYKISGYTFAVNEGLDIYFSQTLYGALSNPQPMLGPQWFASSSTVIDPGGAPQIYDVITVVPNPSLDVVFSVDFVWLGQGTPGSQPFDAYRTINGGLGVFDAGRTVATTVPEAGSSLLLASLAFGALATPRFFRRSAK